MSDTLAPCPFCGDRPSFSDVEDVNDRRYKEMRLECCITMRSNISYGLYRLMKDQDIEATLRTKLTRKWNNRVQPELEGWTIERAKQGILDCIRIHSPAGRRAWISPLDLNPASVLYELAEDLIKDK